MQCKSNNTWKHYISENRDTLQVNSQDIKNITKVKVK